MILFSSTVPPQSMGSDYKGAVAAGGHVEIWCMAQTSNPPVDILWTWKEDGNRIVSDDIRTTYIDGEFHGRLTRSVLVLSADKRRNGKIVRCMPRLDGVVLENMTQEFKLNITCE